MLIFPESTGSAVSLFLELETCLVVRIWAMALLYALLTTVYGGVCVDALGRGCSTVGTWDHWAAMFWTALTFCEHGTVDSASTE
jgi:hypothetical protein